MSEYVNCNYDVLIYGSESVNQQASPADAVIVKVPTLLYVAPVLYFDSKYAAVQTELSHYPTFIKHGKIGDYSDMDALAGILYVGFTPASCLKVAEDIIKDDSKIYEFTDEIKKSLYEIDLAWVAEKDVYGSLSPSEKMFISEETFDSMKPVVEDAAETEEEEPSKESDDGESSDAE